MALQMETLAALDAFLVELNQAGADVILPLFRTENGLLNKAGPGAFDPVTAADRGAEAAIRALVAARHPAHGVVGEEQGEDRPDAEFVWVVDPIDGTRAFVAGLPVWTTLIALRFQGRPVLGSIGQPYTGELFIGSAAGSRLQSRAGSTPLRVRPCERLRGAVVATTDPDGCFRGPERDAWTRVREDAAIARTGCDAYAYAMVAHGFVDIVVEAGLKSWDVEAAVPLLEGAGGLVTDWRGAPIGRHGGQMVIAGDRRCLEDALVHLAPAAR